MAGSGGGGGCQCNYNSPNCCYCYPIGDPSGYPYRHIILIAVMAIVKLFVSL